MKLSTKISLGMGALTVLASILAFYLLAQIDAVNEISTELADKKMPILNLVGQLSTDVAQQRIVEIRHLSCTDAAAKNEEETTLNKWREKIGKEYEELDKTLYVSSAREIFNRLATARQAYREVSTRLLDLSRQSKDQEAMALLNGESRKKFDAFTTILEELAKITLANSQKVSQEGDERYDSSRTIGITLTLVAVFIAIVLTWLIVRNTVRQLGKDPGELNNIARRVVDGDYNVDDGGAKLGVYASIVEMVSALKTHIDNAQRESENAREQSRKAQEAMQQAEAASREAQAKTEAMLVAADKLEAVGNVVSSASTQLSAQIEQSDRGAAESAQRLSEAATAMNEMNATVQEVARNAGSASSASAETKQKAEAGAQVVGKAVQSIDQVHQMSLELKEDMVQLNEHAQNITRIMGVISDIADQTNLLALNAAIEAARAGDAGRGFAVVADEVRKLAEKTMASTNDVGNAIKAIQESTAKSMTGV
ncbi:MAG: methyl-accepting chemotaxis protein, partial [Desulfovibrio fairfieldensis]|nr:methyl-accepting chemotaxis protein [Desulfovibrio fairfieldensis]